MSLKDIAAEVGVSISTVSRVLNTDNPSAARPELQRKIWEVAKQQRYCPNPIARRLKDKSSIITPEVQYINCIYGCIPQETKDDPFYLQLLKSVEQEAFRHDYHVSCAYTATPGDSFFESPLLSNVPSDLLIILGRFKPELLNKLKPTYKKIVNICLNVLDVDCDQIICSGRKMLFSSVEYLHSLNHEKIGFIGNHEQRYLGYHDGILTFGLPDDPRYVVDDIIISMEGGYLGALRLLERAPEITAICCANDIIAIGALRACNEKGLRVPEDISIIGVNDIENTQYTNPMLTTVRVPLKEMGQTAVTVLLDRVNGGHSSYIKVEFPFQIVKRGSCRALNP